MNTITCKEAIDSFLDAYVEQELTPELQQRFEDHLMVCPACVDYLAMYRGTIALTRAAARGEALDEPPQRLIEAILATLREPARPKTPEG